MEPNIEGRMEPDIEGRMEPNIEGKVQLLILFDNIILELTCKLFDFILFK